MRERNGVVPMANDANSPSFRGVRIYDDPDGVYRIRLPNDWHVFSLPDGLDGAMYSPQPNEPLTWFSAWKAQLPESVRPRDLRVLRAGLDQGIRALGGSPEVVSSSDDALVHLIRLERVFTFLQDGVQRKRKQWVLYADRWQICLVYQGATAHEYEYWLPMANYAFLTFEIPLVRWSVANQECGLPRLGRQ